MLLFFIMCLFYEMGHKNNLNVIVIFLEDMITGFPFALNLKQKGKILWTERGETVRLRNNEH